MESQALEPETGFHTVLAPFSGDAAGVSCASAPGQRSVCRKTTSPEGVSDEGRLERSATFASTGLAWPLLSERERTSVADDSCQNPWPRWNLIPSSKSSAVYREELVLGVPRYDKA